MENKENQVVSSESISAEQLNRPLTGAELYAQRLATQQRIQELTCELQSLKYPNDKYDMGIWDNFVNQFLKKYAVFSGRASRSEFWQVAIAQYAVYAIVALVSALLAFIQPMVGFMVGYMFIILWCYAIMLPSLALQIRRLHDIGKSGWFCLVSLVPFIGPFILLYWNCQRGVEGPNEYGNKTAFEPITSEVAAMTKLRKTPSNGMRLAVVGAIILIFIISAAMFGSAIDSWTNSAPFTNPGSSSFGNGQGF